MGRILRFELIGLESSWVYFSVLNIGLLTIPPIMTHGKGLPIMQSSYESFSLRNLPRIYECIVWLWYETMIHAMAYR